MIEFLALSGIFFYIYLLYSILQKLLHFLSARTQKQLPNHLNLIRTNFDFDEPEQPFSQQTQTITKYNQKKKKYKEAQEKKSREGVISRYKTKHKENMKIIQCLQQKKRQKDTLLIEEMLNQFLSQPVSHAIANNFKNFVYRKKNFYDIESRLFWIELYCNLKTTQYTYVSNLLNGPCTLTINSWIKTENIPCFCDFSQINKIKNIIRYFTDILQDKVELPEELYVNISVDATHVEQCFHRKKKEIYGVLDSGKKIISKYDPFYSNDCLLYRKMMAELIENNSFINNIFIFMINPFFTVSSFPVFVYTSNNGSADQNILNSLQNISKEISSPFRVIMHSYDADPSYDSAQTKYFEKWTKYFKKSSELLSIKDCVMTPNDPAHILKRIRKHLIKYGAVFLKNYNSKEAISKNTFYQYDTTMPSYIWSSNTLNSMDDFYPYIMFSDNILQKAFLKEDYIFVLYLIPSVSINLLIRCKTLTRVERLKISYIALFTTLNYYSLYKNGIITSKSKKFVAFYNRKVCIHLANYFSSVIIVLTNIPCAFSIGKIGTINSENFFGQIKKNLNDKTYFSFINSFERRILAHKYNFKSYKKVRRRWFECTMIEEGTVHLTLQEINQCASFSNFIFYLNHVRLPSEYAFQKIMYICQTEMFDMIKIFFDKERKENLIFQRIHGSNIQRSFIISNAFKKLYESNNLSSIQINQTNQNQTNQNQTNQNQTNQNQTNQNQINQNQTNQNQINQNQINQNQINQNQINTKGAFFNTFPSRLFKSQKPSSYIQIHYTGIPNHKASSCYINVVIQLLFHINKFVEIITNSSSTDEFNQTTKTLLNQYRNNRIDMPNFIRIVEKTSSRMFVDGEMDDPLLFLDFMIRRLTKTLVNYDNLNFDLLFFGKSENVKTCQCGFTQTTNNDFTSLTISVDSSETIEEALKNYFQPDILLNYSCEHCLLQTSVRTIDMIARMPYFLVLRVRVGSGIPKIKPDNILRWNLNKYHLFGILLYSNFHYKVILREKMWMEYNDSGIQSIVNLQEYLKSEAIDALIYLLE